MQLFWRLATGPLAPVFQHAVLAWVFLILYSVFGDVVKNYYLASLVLLVIFSIPITNGLRRLAEKYNPRHF
jgi:hypothetical protein